MASIDRPEQLRVFAVPPRRVTRGAPVTIGAIQQASGSIIVGLRLRPAHPFQFQPPSSSRLRPAQELLALGTDDQLARLETILADASIA